MRARDNPFRADRVLKVRFRLQGITWDELIGRLQALRWRGAIVGPEGSGKTTLLEELARRLDCRGIGARMVRIDNEGRRRPLGLLRGAVADTAPDEVMLLDGADGLGPIAWRWVKGLSRRIGGLVVTSHRLGLLPTLHECSTSPELLAGIVSELTPHHACARVPAARRLFTEHDGDLRGALRALYNASAALPT